MAPVPKPVSITGDVFTFFHSCPVGSWTYTLYASEPSCEPLQRSVTPSPVGIATTRSGGRARPGATTGRFLNGPGTNGGGSLGFTNFGPSGGSFSR